MNEQALVIKLTVLHHNNCVLVYAICLHEPAFVVAIQV